MTLRICIVGTAPHWNEAPYSNPDWTIWGCSPGIAGVLPRWDAWFELHDGAAKSTFVSPEYNAFLSQKHGKPIYMQGRYDNVPDVVVFPRDAMVAEFGGKFFTSSMAWMLAFAISKKPKEIGLFGVDMGHGTEYGHQRPGCWHFIELAKSRGIKITLAEKSLLNIEPALYGITNQTPFEKAARERLAGLRTKVEESKAAIADLQRTLHWQEGAVVTLEDLLNAYCG